MSWYAVSLSCHIFVIAADQPVGGLSLKSLRSLKTLMTLRLLFPAAGGINFATLHCVPRRSLIPIGEYRFRFWSKPLCTYLKHRIYLYCVKSISDNIFAVIAPCGFICIDCTMRNVYFIIHAVLRIAQCRFTSQNRRFLRFAIYFEKPFAFSECLLANGLNAFAENDSSEPLAIFKCFCAYRYYRIRNVDSGKPCSGKC